MGTTTTTRLLLCALAVAAASSFVACAAAPDRGFERSKNEELSAFAGVLTQHNDLNRSGANLAETALTTANVKSGSFGWLTNYVVKGQVYAQPLYVPKGTYNGVVLSQNIVIIATESNDVYAFNADPPWGAYWPALPDGLNLGAPGKPPSGCLNTSPDIGVGSTPVVDPATATIYVVAKTTVALPVGSKYMLHALNLFTGQEKFGGPVDMSMDASNSPVFVTGSGPGSSGGKILFNAGLHQNRVALTLSQGVLSIGFASHCDGSFDPSPPSYHGWVLRHDAATLKSLPPYLTTPNTSEGGFWQGGGGFAVDGSGSLYMVSGNGAKTATDTTGNELANAVIKGKGGLGQPLSVASGDWFMPSDVLNLDVNDLDIGSSGPLLIPGSPDPQRLVAGGKNGILYLLNSAALGRFNATPQSVQQLAVGASTGSQIYGGPVFWDAPAPVGPTLYIWPTQTPLRAYSFNRSTGQFSTTPKSQATSLDSYYPGGELALSANGSTSGTGILWATHASNSSAGGGGVVPGELIAFNAETLGILWRSSTDAHSLASFAKFTSPTVANGRVYVPTFSNAVQVYGLTTSGGTVDAGTDAGSTLLTCDQLLAADVAAGKVQPTTFSYLFANYLAVNDPNGALTPGHCATAGCHGSLPTNGNFLCGTTKDSCYAGLKATTWLDPTDGTKSLIGDPAKSFLSWFGMPPTGPVGSFMPRFAEATNARAAAAVCGWVRAGALLDCSAPQQNCSGACFDVSRDNAHCGNCTTVCAAGTSCTNGKCSSSNGASCTASSQCNSGICVDGHCCNSACNGSCLSCSTGTCSAVKSAEDADSCSGTSMCDSSGTCTNRITTFTYPTQSGARIITGRSDGTLWFVERDSGLVGRVSVANGAISESQASPSGWANGIAETSDGSIWYTDQGANVKRINSQGQVSTFALPSFGYTQGVTVRGSNEIWVGVWSNDGVSADHIVHLDGATGAVVASFTLPAKTGPYGMAAGPDGNVWFAEYLPPAVGRITPAGQITHFALPTNIPMNPVTIAAGADGALWFGGGGSDAMGRITTAGTMTFYAAQDIINTIVSGPDGNIWYTGYNGTLGRMTPAGVATKYAFPGANPYGLALGTDGNLWFTDDSANRIVRFKLK